MRGEQDHEAENSWCHNSIVADGSVILLGNPATRRAELGCSNFGLPDSNGYSYGHANADAHRHAYSDAYSNTYTHADTNANANTNTDAHADADTAPCTAKPDGSV